MRAGSLTLVGTGIQFPDHLTIAARNTIAGADIVVYVVDNPRTDAWLHETARRAEPLRPLRPRDTTSQRLEVYEEMVDRTLEYVRSGLRVCAVFSGHPGMFSYPGHEAYRRALAEGYAAEILPAVSAVDCLYADLGLDPGYHGYQVFDATDFLIHRRVVNVESDLVLLQPAMVGDPDYERYRAPGLSNLVEVLTEHYGEDHEIILYTAATQSDETTSIVKLPIRALAEAALTKLSTLFVPPAHEPAADLDMLIRLARARQ